MKQARAVVSARQGGPQHWSQVWRSGSGAAAASGRTAFRVGRSDASDRPLTLTLDIGAAIQQRRAAVQARIVGALEAEAQRIFGQPALIESHPRADAESRESWTAIVVKVSGSPAVLLAGEVALQRALIEQYPAYLNDFSIVCRRAR